MAALLARADVDIAARRPVCRASGNCCKFEQHGHRLYVTAAELAHFALVHVSAPQQSKIQTQYSKSDTPQTLPLQQFFAQQKPTGCPYQINNLCTAREARPLGCRIYFCDANAQSWQNDLYEKYHNELKTLHAQFNLPYRYLEWRAALHELLQSPASNERCAPHLARGDTR
jgi:Fe-S-cluster containining protein